MTKLDFSAADNLFQPKTAAAADKEAGLPPRSPDSQRLPVLRRIVTYQCHEIPRFKLTGAQRMNLASFVFKDAPEFIGAVSGPLDKEPALFAQFGITGKALEEKLSRSLELQSTSAMFRELAEWTADLALFEKADAIQVAMMIVRQVRGENALPLPPAGAAERQAALRDAEGVLAKRQGQKIEVAKKKKKALSRAEQAVSAAGDDGMVTEQPSSSRGKPHGRAASPFVDRDVQVVLPSWAYPHRENKAPADDRPAARPPDRAVAQPPDRHPDRHSDRPAHPTDRPRNRPEKPKHRKAKPST